MVSFLFPLKGKCTVCKSTIHHPKSLVVHGAFGEDEDVATNAWRAWRLWG